MCGEIKLDKAFKRIGDPIVGNLPWLGHARGETLSSIWKRYGMERVAIAADGYRERDVWIPIPEDKNILGIRAQNPSDRSQQGIFVVTRKATKDEIENEVDHDRRPVLVDK